MQRIVDIIIRWTLSRTAFAASSLALAGYCALGMTQLYTTGAGDYWEHLSAMVAFSQNPVAPSNPSVLSSVPTHLFTPYHQMWGAIAWLSRLHPSALLPLCAAVNCLVFMAGVYAFAHRIIGDQRYALPLGMSLLFLWNRPWEWSGFYNFGLLPTTAVYPYWPALGIALMCIAWYREPTGTRSLDAACTVGVGAAFLLHPLSGTFALIGTIVKAALRTDAPLDARLGWTLAPVAALVALALAWPYYPVLGTVVGSGQFSKIGFAGEWKIFYEDAVWRTLPAVVGVALLLLRIVRRRFDVVTIAFAIAGTVYVLNAFTVHSPVASRFIIFLTLLSQVAIVQSLKQTEGTRIYRAAFVTFLAAVMVMLPYQAYSSAKRLAPVRDVALGRQLGAHAAESGLIRFRALRTVLGPTDVVLAPMDVSWELPGSTGCKVVGVENPTPFLRDHGARQAATEQFFSRSASDSRRSDILSRYSVDYVLVPDGYPCPRDRRLTSVVEAPDFTLYGVR